MGVYSVRAEAWLKKTLHIIFEVSSSCQSSVWPAQVLHSDSESLGYIRKQDFQEEALWGTTLRCEEKALSHDLFVCIHILSDWGSSWFTKASLLNAFLAGGSDDAWADAEDISEEDSAFRFVCMIGMRKREFADWLSHSVLLFSSLGFEHRLETHQEAQGLTFLAFGKESWVLMAGWSLLIYFQRKSWTQEYVEPLKMHLKGVAVFTSPKSTSPGCKNCAVSYVFLAEQSEMWEGTTSTKLSVSVYRVWLGSCCAAYG